MRTFSSHVWRTVIVVFVVALGIPGCGKGEGSATSPDPSRCELRDLGEAADLVSSGGAIPDDQYITLSGISNPKSILWQDDVTKRAHYIVKIMGAGEKLLYTEELPTGKEPRILSEFKGTIRLWKNIDPKESGPLGRALARQWKTKVDPETTYIIYGGKKPDGCQ